MIYDRHEWIYAYGDLAAYEAVVRRRGLAEGELTLPVPHTHNYHAACDADEDALMEY